MKSMLKKIFFKLLGERKKDYIRVILSGIFCISVVFFSTSVGSSLVYISTGRRATMTELVMEVEKNDPAIMQCSIYWESKRNTDICILAVNISESF